MMLNGLKAQPMYSMTVTLKQRNTTPSTPSISRDTAGALDAPIPTATAMDSTSRSFGIRDLQHVRNAGPTSWTYVEEFSCGPPAVPGGGFNCTVFVFQQEFALDAAVGSAGLKSACVCVTNRMPLGCPLPLTHTITNINHVATLKARFQTHSKLLANRPPRLKRTGIGRFK
jgi:hypothetical protein